MRSFLVIGLGGSGGKTIRYLKQSLNEWLAVAPGALTRRVASDDSAAAVLGR